MEIKREVAVLLPYNIIDGKPRVFLQKRQERARVLPGKFSFFGGKLEVGETPDQALQREIQEELNIKTVDHVFLGQYDSSVDKGIVLHVYFEKVSDAFENEIVVNEGEFGKFFTKEEVMAEPQLIDSDKKILEDFFHKISHE